MTKDPDVPPEEKEKWNLDRERELDTLNDCMMVERVIGSREVEDGTEYYVKCECCLGFRTRSRSGSKC